MKNKIIDIAKQNKISEIGFCSVKSYNQYASGIKSDAAFVKETDENSPEKILSGAKTVIVCAFGYYTKEKGGNISRYARGKDYHIVATEKMQPIIELLKRNGYNGISFSDNGSLNERLLSGLSGIAFMGKNRMAINNRLGSYFFVGYIITNCEIEPDEPNNNTCAGCGRCYEMCPLGAISNDGFCEMRCLSYITQKKGELSEMEENAIGGAGKIWGCDICQEVCPHNSNLEETDIDEFNSDLIVNLEIDEDITNKEFKNLYSQRAFTWRGKGVLIRNQKILKNFQKKLDK